MTGRKSGGYPLASPATGSGRKSVLIAMVEDMLYVAQRASNFNQSCR